MTFLGKTLVVVILTLSVLFMCFAGAVYTAHTNWREQNTKLKSQLAEAQNKATSDLAALQTTLDQVKASLALVQNEKTAADGQIKNLTDEVARLDADNKQLKTLADSERTRSELNVAEAEERKNESQVQRKRNAELNDSRNELATNLNAANDKIFSLDLQLTQAKAKVEQQLKELAIMRAFLASKDLPTDTRMMTVGVAPPPPVYGKIFEARRETKGSRVFVEISLGSDDGLVLGHTLTVYRGDKYLGKIRLEDVRPDKAVGVVVETAPNSVIQAGDKVTSKI